MAGEHHIILQEKEKAMAFKTIMTTIKDSFSLCERLKLNQRPFSVYRYDPEKDMYVFFIPGVNRDNPGKVFIVWDNMICKMIACPTEPFNMSNGKPEKYFEIRGIFVPENFNKDVDMLIDILEQAFDDFHFIINGKLHIIKIIIDKQDLKENINYEI